MEIQGEGGGRQREARRNFQSEEWDLKGGRAED